jgi:hypothetical protein
MMTLPNATSCHVCTAHGELIHFAQKEYLGDDFFVSSPPKEWENASDVFPEAHFEATVAQKLKAGIRDDDVNQYLSEALGISLCSKPNNSTIEYPDDEEDESDDDFDSECEKEDGAEGSDSDDSLEVEKELLKEKIDKDELDALSVGSDEGYIGTGGNSQCRRIMRTRYSSRQANGDVSSDEEDSDSSADKPDVGALDTANM